MRDRGYVCRTGLLRVVPERAKFGLRLWYEPSGRIGEDEGSTGRTLAPDTHFLGIRRGSKVYLAFTLYR